MNYREFFDRDVFATAVGIELQGVTKGSAVATLTIGPEHLNAGGVAQGGVLFTLADLVMAAACNSYGKLAFSVQADIRFLQSAKSGDRLTAVAEIVFPHKRLSHLKATITNEQGELVAVAESICNVKPEVDNHLEVEE